MKDWNDFLPDDDNEFDENEDKDLFGINQQLQIDKKMFLNDCVKGSVPLDPFEYEQLFGKPTQEDLNWLSEAFFFHFHQQGFKESTLIRLWGMDWLYDIMKNLEQQEEYELCDIVKWVLQGHEKGVKALLDNAGIK